MEEHGGRRGRGRGRGYSNTPPSPENDYSEGGGRGRGTRPKRQDVKNVDWAGHKKAKEVFDKKKGSFGVEISNFDKEATRGELIAFLNKQTSFTFQSCDLVTGENGFPVLKLCLKEKQEARELLALNGKMWRSRKLYVKPVDVDTSSKKQHLNLQLLPRYIEQLYNSKGRFLDLAKLNMSQEVRCNLNSFGFMQALWKILAEKCPQVKTISFGYNGITTLKAFANLHEFCPDLINLSFEGNNIGDVTEVDSLKGLRLRELLFINNPIQSVAGYHSEICRRFPSLRYLDKIRTNPLIQFKLPPHVLQATLPPIHGSYFDAQDHSTLVIDWVSKYISNYDEKDRRSALLDAYTSNALFSISAHVPPPPDTQPQNGRRGLVRGSSFVGQVDSTPEHAISSYGPISRNLTQVFSGEDRKKRLIHSNIDIVSFLRNLPATKHLMGDVVCDSNLLHVGGTEILMISLHGIYWEITGPSSGINRNFSRTWTLKPATQDSRAFAEGWRAVILNDMLTVHEYIGHLPNTEDTVFGNTGNSLFNSSTTTTTNNTPFGPFPNSSNTPSFLDMSSPFGSLGTNKNTDPDAAKYGCIEKFVAVTGLKEEWATKLLESHGWNYEKTVYDFMLSQEKGEIPANYFTPRRV